jgi:uncharacterized membrane protein
MKAPPSPPAKPPLAKLGRILPWLLIACGVIGVVASVVITVEKLHLLENPAYQPACDLNPIISCGSVMKSPQSHAFGFTNTYIGLIGFPVVVTTGAAMLAGAAFKRWWWLGMQAGLTFGVSFAGWLLWQSVYRIGALCPWCLSVDVAVLTAFWYVTLYNFYNGFIRLPVRLRTFGRFVQRHHVDALLLIFVFTVAAVLQHFWYYFGAQL